MTNEQIEEKMTELRNQYKTSCGVEKNVLRIRGLLLKYALEKRFKNAPIQTQMSTPIEA